METKQPSNTMTPAATATTTATRTLSSYAVILNPYYKNTGGCPLVRHAIATVKAMFPSVVEERRFLVRHIYHHCRDTLRMVFYCSQADGEVTTYTLATDDQVEVFLDKALRNGFDNAMNGMDDSFERFIDTFRSDRSLP